MLAWVQAVRKLPRSRLRGTPSGCSARSLGVFSASKKNSTIGAEREDEQGREQDVGGAGPCVPGPRRRRTGAGTAPGASSGAGLGRVAVVVVVVSPTA